MHRNLAMGYIRTIVCLANSTKHHPSRCIAGKEWSILGAGRWLRPVCDYNVNEGAIPVTSSRLQNGLQPQVLDILQIPFDSASPHGCQVENHLISGGAWQRQGRLQWPNLEAMVEVHQDLWGAGNSSSNGLNDRLSLQEACAQTDSLRLLRPENFRLVVSTTGAAFNNPRKGMRALFNVGKISYNLKVTDPRYTDRIRDYAEDVPYPIENCIVCVSIGDAFNSYHYKLIATIFIRENL
jgi:hypothetical protein